MIFNSIPTKGNCKFKKRSDTTPNGFLKCLQDRRYQTIEEQVKENND